jgi:AcrR family transcriptional regulator
MSEPSGGSDFKLTLKLLWGTRERAAKGPKPTLTVPRIVEAAIALADSDGLEAVSMRRVADRLNVGAMSLYRYVPGKAELLELMLDTIHAEHALEFSGPWRTRLERLARETRAMIQRHPWMLQITVGQRPPLGPNILAVFDAHLRALKESGLTPPETIAAVELIGSYVYGATRANVEAKQVEEQSGISDEDWWGDRMSFWEEYFDPERFPAISVMWDEGGYENPLDPFEFGLERVLDGIEALLERR